MNGKGDRNRTRDFRKYREGWERVFGRARGAGKKLKVQPVPGR